MKHAAHIRLWTMLTRVRQLRVERKRRLLNEARMEARRAVADIERKEAVIAQHETRRVEILSACGPRDRATSLWRAALHRHDADRPALEEALADAVRAGQLRAVEAASAARTLQREMLGEIDARERSRRLKREQNEGDAED